MEALPTQNLPCRKLFQLFANQSGPQVSGFAAVTDDGALIYMTEELAGMSAAMYLKQCFWRLSKEEFRARVEKARRNGRLQKAIQAGWTTMAEIERLCK